MRSAGTRPQLKRWNKEGRLQNEECGMKNGFFPAALLEPHSLFCFFLPLAFLQQAKRWAVSSMGLSPAFRFRRFRRVSSGQGARKSCA